MSSKIPAVVGQHLDAIRCISGIKKKIPSEESWFLIKLFYLSVCLFVMKVSS